MMFVVTCSGIQVQRQDTEYAVTVRFVRVKFFWFLCVYLVVPILVVDRISICLVLLQNSDSPGFPGF
jgi:hypothetical protein